MSTALRPTRTGRRTATGGDGVSDTRNDAHDEGADDGPRSDGVRPRELVLLAVAVLGIVTTVFFGLRWKDLHDDEVQRQDVEESANQFLNAMFEWDGATIDEDFDRIIGFSTGEFEEQARSTFANDETRQSLAENRASERAESVDVFVQSIQGDDARVFGVVDVRATNASLQVPRADTVRVEIGMTKVDGEWRVYDFNVFDGFTLGLPSGAAETAPTEPTDPAGG